MILPSLLVLSQGWGLIDLPLRASNEGLLRPRVARAQKIIRLHPLLSSTTQSGRPPRKRAARWLLHCACRTSTVSSCAFHEQWRSALHFLSSFYHLVEGGGWLWCSSLRASENSLNCHS